MYIIASVHPFEPVSQNYGTPRPPPKKNTPIWWYMGISWYIMVYEIFGQTTISTYIHVSF
jgi:hypothetical protein